MSATQTPPQWAGLMVEPFPRGGLLVENAYRELGLAANGMDARKPGLGELRKLPRPWDPPSCEAPGLRRELWAWLDAVVTWLNTQYVWDTAGVIPGCWPQHPHLVHEIATLADQRRRAGLALNGDLLEQWHRISLPAFTERMSSRTKDHCHNGHQPCPARGRHARHLSESSTRTRQTTYEADLNHAETLCGG